jgi:polysaccharide pyruvyl transferase WcaK-like protein
VFIRGIYLEFGMNTIQIKHITRSIKQWLFKPKVGIVGGYHGGNLGDIALGESVAALLREKNIPTGLQTIYNLKKWPETFYAIVGGGAVGYTGPLMQLYDRYKNNLNRVALLGVDFNEHEYNEACLDIIRKAAYVSSRSKSQADRLIAMSGRKDIHFHPDLAFSLEKEFCKRMREKSKLNKNKLLLINVVPLYAKIVGEEIIPIDQYASERPELYANFQLMHESYKIAIIKLVHDALQDGFVIETIPFTQEDEAYGKIVLKGLPVVHNVYHNNPKRMLQKIADAEWVCATRFHATIFALKLSKKLSALAYARKNELLLQELGVRREDFLSTDDLAKGMNSFPNTIHVENATITEWENNSTYAIETCIQTLLKQG